MTLIPIDLAVPATIFIADSTVKAFNVAKKIDYYCYSLRDFKNEEDIRYENIPDLCDKFKIKKNLINPIYIS